MERLYFLVIMMMMAIGLQAQNVGINTTTPVMPLHVASSVGNLTVFENTNPLAGGVESGLYFADGLNGPNTTKYTGAIKSIGTGSDYARLGLFTYASPSPTSLVERLSITDDGNVGIGTTNPSYKLDVAGSIRAQGGLQVNGSLYLSGVLNPNTVLTIGSNATVGGTLTVSNGRGIVRSVNATQMKIERVNVGFSGTGVAAGATITSGNLFFGEAFSSVTVTIGQVYNAAGDWAKVLIVPFNVDLAASTCQFNLTNTSNSPITFTGNWEVVLIGS